MTRILTILITAAFLITPSAAEQTPAPGAHDPRVRTVDYNTSNVVKVTTYYGVSTHIQYGEDENIIHIAIGDPLAWEVVPKSRHLFIKPREQKADTNVTVITNKRVYQMILAVDTGSIKDPNAWQKDTLIFSLRYRYPEEEAARFKAELEAAQAIVKEAARAQDMAKARAEVIKQEEAAKETIIKQLEAKRIRNDDYWVKGSQYVSPTTTHDDGRFIYLTFSNNKALPAVYELDEHGNEALLNTHIQDGNTIVVQRIARRLMLRLGNDVAMVENRAYQPDTGMDNRTGTVSEGVVREIKGAKK